MGGHDDVPPRLWRLAYDKRDLLIREWSGSSLDPSKISLLFASLYFPPGLCLPLTPPTAEQGRAQDKKDVGLDFFTVVFCTELCVFKNLQASGYQSGSVCVCERERERERKRERDREREREYVRVRR